MINDKRGMEKMVLFLTVTVLIFGHLHLSTMASGPTYSNQWVLKGDLSRSDIANIARRYGFRFVTKLLDDHFLFVKKKSVEASKVMSRYLAKRLSREKRVESVSQQTWQRRSLKQGAFSVSDTKWPLMWYYNGPRADMGVQKSWSQGYNGSEITIAIVDDGVEYLHPDLNQNYVGGLDVYSNDNDPRPSYGNKHGTECAGVAVAIKNNQCVIGSAYEAKFQAIRLIGPNGVTDAGEQQAFTRPGVDIFSNSWGANEGTTFDGPKALSQQGLLSGVTNGRGKRGSIYITASGNGGLEDNCNCDGYANSIYTIAISAVTSKLEPPGYAEPCAATLASAYSGAGNNIDNVCTTGIGNSCPCNFTGTSAAAPMAAGILALLLQTNQNLTWRDVQHLIVRNSISKGLTYGDFFTNGAGYKVSDTYGYGLLNATALISEGKQWKTVDQQHACMAGSKTVNSEIVPNAPVRTIDSTINTDGCNSTETCVNSVEHVQVFVSFYATLRGTVQLTLQSPMGTKSQLLTRRNLDLSRNIQQDWTYMSVQFWDEDPVGEWKLSLSLDRDPSEGAILRSWSLTIHGTGEVCTVIKVTSTLIPKSTPSTLSTQTSTNDGKEITDSCEVEESENSCTEGCEALCVTLILVCFVIVVLCVALIIIFCKKHNRAKSLSCIGKHNPNVTDSTNVHSNKHQISHDSRDAKEDTFSANYNQIYYQDVQ